MLLFTGWNLQAVKPQEWLSFTTRRHCPDAGFHTLAVPSKDAESIKSLVIDQSKSNKKQNSMSMAVAGVRGSQRLLLEYKCIMQNVNSAESIMHWIFEENLWFLQGIKMESLWNIMGKLNQILIYFVQNFSLTECRVYKTCILLRGERHSDHLIILQKGRTQRPAQAFKPILSTRPQLFKGQIFTG